MNPITSPTISTAHDTTISAVQSKNSIPIRWKVISLIALPLSAYLLYNLLREYPCPSKPLPQDWREACKIRPLTEEMQTECDLAYLNRIPSFSARIK